jgi:hypothetical protein
LFASVAATPAPDEFFIISSVDAAKSRLILKRPTEVTVVMGVTDRTVIRGERGESLRLAALRAGDTIYVMSRSQSNGEMTASSIRRGPMTVDELHRRYIRP